MKHTTYLGKAINICLDQHDRMTQTQLARLTGLRQTTISDLISKPKRPDVTTLKALCTSWPDARTGILLLIEHLRDEIGRAGHDPENAIDLSARDHKLPATQHERDLSVIQAHLADDGVSELLHDLATILRRSEKSRFDLQERQIAERPESYAQKKPR